MPVGSNFTLQFSETVVVGSGTITLVSATGNLSMNVIESSMVQVTGSVVTINPLVDLLAGTDYHLVISPGAFLDTKGNKFAGLSDPATFNFTTAPAPFDPEDSDLNGDGRGDLVFKNATTGQTVIWYSAPAGAYAPVALIQVTPDWGIVDAGDFTGDGRSDLLWRNTKGEVVTWDSTGNFITGRYLGEVPTIFKIEQVADFTGDGRADILWRNTANDQVTLWTSQADNKFGTAVIGAVGQEWKAEVAGDFNGDGKDDILWRDTAGNISIWSGTGSGFTGAPGNIGVSNPTFLGSGDFNFDGKDDVALINILGSVVIWFGSDTGFAPTALIGGGIPSGWTFEQISDMNGDGRDDIVWRAANGDVMVWNTGHGTAGQVTPATIASIPNEWQIF